MSAIKDLNLKIKKLDKFVQEEAKNLAQSELLPKINENLQKKIMKSKKRSIKEEEDFSTQDNSSAGFDDTQLENMLNGEEDDEISLEGDDMEDDFSMDEEDMEDDDFSMEEEEEVEDDDMDFSMDEEDDMEDDDMDFSMEEEDMEDDDMDFSMDEEEVMSEGEDWEDLGDEDITEGEDWEDLGDEDITEGWEEEDEDSFSESNLMPEKQIYKEAKNLKAKLKILESIKKNPSKIVEKFKQSEKKRNQYWKALNLLAEKHARLENSIIKEKRVNKILAQKYVKLEEGYKKARLNEAKAIKLATLVSTAPQQLTSTSLKKLAEKFDQCKSVKDIKSLTESVKKTFKEYETKKALLESKKKGEKNVKSLKEEALKQKQNLQNVQAQNKNVLTEAEKRAIYLSTGTNIEGEEGYMNF